MESNLIQLLNRMRESETSRDLQRAKREEFLKNNPIELKQKITPKKNT